MQNNLQLCAAQLLVACNALQIRADADHYKQTKDMQVQFALYQGRAPAASSLDSITGSWMLLLLL